MSVLIKRFKEDLQLSGYAQRSIQSYTSSVLRLQRFYSLEEITEEELRQYWLCCQSEFGWSAASFYSGISHFFKKTLVRPWNIFREIKWKREETLPTILSLQEVRRIIYAMPTVQSHTFYLTLYSLGLRLREATTLQVRDILSDRGLVHIHAGKGALDRMVPLPKITLETLRNYYRMCFGWRSPIAGSKALIIIRSDFSIRIVSRRNGKPWPLMPWNLSDGFSSMYCQPDL